MRTGIRNFRLFAILAVAALLLSPLDATLLHLTSRKISAAEIVMGVHAVPQPSPHGSSKVAAFTLQLNPEASGTLLSPAKVNIAWRLQNRSRSIGDGQLDATLDNRPIETVTSHLVSVGPGSEISGSFVLSSLPAATHTVALHFRIFIGGTHFELLGPTGIQRVRNSKLAAQIETTITVYDDVDNDGIADGLEHRLLERFRPYYLFSNDGGDEDYLPADTLWYIARSEVLPSGSEDDKPLVPREVLAQNQTAVLFDTGRYGSSNFTVNGVETNYHLNPKESVEGEQETNPGRHGNSLSEVLTRKNVGLYGHVVPVKLADPYGFTFEPLSNKGELKTYYKIEYWQFFGYNEAEQSYIGNHEGDWTSVQLIYDPEANTIRSVFHFAHGVLFRFDLTPENFARNESFQGPDGEIRESRGAVNYSTELDLSHLDLGTSPPRIVLNDEPVRKAQNNLVRFFKDPQTGDFTHPVVYIENGTHEFFPSEHWKYYGAPNHNGQSHHYLTTTPPNLGEVDTPLSESAAAKIILWFNGYWGAFSRFNDPPPGPTLHKNWTMLSESRSEGTRAKLKLGF